MPTLLALEALEAERRYVQRQLEEAGDDGWGTARLMWESRLQELDRQMEELAVSRPNLASVVLIFDGVPVIGTSDINLDFATSALARFQEVVETAYATRTSKSVSQYGPVAGVDRSRLFIRDIARGSFGFIVEEVVADQHEMFPTLLKETIESSTALIAEFGAADEEQFGALLEATDPRLLKDLRGFAQVLFDAKASVRIVGDEQQAHLSVLDAGRLASRLKEVRVVEAVEPIQGRFRGTLPESHQFEFRREDEAKGIRGAATDEFVLKYDNDHLFRNRALAEPVVALIRVTRTYRGEQLVQERFTLEGIELQAEGEQPQPHF